jgi:hypothetical protein
MAANGGAYQKHVAAPRLCIRRIYNIWKGTVIYEMALRKSRHLRHRDISFFGSANQSVLIGRNVLASSMHRAGLIAAAVCRRLCCGMSLWR